MRIFDFHIGALIIITLHSMAFVANGEELSFSGRTIVGAQVPICEKPTTTVANLSFGDNYSDKCLIRVGAIVRGYCDGKVEGVVDSIAFKSYSGRPQKLPIFGSLSIPGWRGKVDDWRGQLFESTDPSERRECGCGEGDSIPENWREGDLDSLTNPGNIWGWRRWSRSPTVFLPPGQDVVITIDRSWEFLIRLKLLDKSCADFFAVNGQSTAQFSNR